MFDLLFPIFFIGINYFSFEGLLKIARYQGVKKYKKMSLEKGGCWRDIKDLLYENQYLVIEPLEIYECMPVVNIFFALNRVFKVDSYIKNMCGYVDWYHAKVKKDKSDPTIDENDTTYFINCNYNGKRLVIIFSYSAHSFRIVDANIEEFKRLDKNVQYEFLIKNLYNIFKNNDKDIGYSQNIDEVFDDSFINFLEIREQSDKHNMSRIRKLTNK